MSGLIDDGLDAVFKGTKLKSVLKTNLGKGDFDVNIEAKDKFEENYMTGLFMIKEIKSIKI